MKSTKNLLSKSQFMLNFRVKQKKIEDFFFQKRNSLGVSTNFLKWYLKEWKYRNLSNSKPKKN